MYFVREGVSLVRSLNFLVSSKRKKEEEEIEEGMVHMVSLIIQKVETILEIGWSGLSDDLFKISVKVFDSYR